MINERDKKVTRLQDKRVVIGLALFCMFLWGSAFPVTKLSYQALGFAQDEVFTRIYYAGLRFILASVMVFGYLLAQRKQHPEFNPRRLDRRGWGFLVVIGLLRITLCYYFYYIALANISGVKGAVLGSASTFITVLLTPLFVREDRFNSGKLVALILGFGGIIVVNWDKGFDMNFTLQGEGYMLLSGLFVALSEVLIKPRGKGIPAPLITWGQLLFGSLPLLAVGYLGREHALDWSGTAVGLLLYSAMISAVAFILWYELLKVNDAGEMALYRLFIPVFGAILSAVVLPNEHFTLYLLLGLSLVVAGIVVLNTWGRKTGNGADS